MAIKFSEDLVPLTDLIVNSGCVVKHATEMPWLLTSRGRVVPNGGHAARCPTYRINRKAGNSE